MDDWIKRDLAHFWHRFTQMHSSDPPLLIERAQGLRLFDAKGKAYDDVISSWWCNVHGHNHPTIQQAIIDQIDALDHVLAAGCTHKGAIALAETLAKLAGLPYVFYSDNGSTAVEVALKMSFQYWQNIGKKEKKRFLSLDRGYHGDTFGAMSVSGKSAFTGPFNPLLFPSYHINSPLCSSCQQKCSLSCLKRCQDILSKHHKEIAAIILEPLLLGAGGMLVYPATYLKRIAELASHFNVHLILDEVATGFGRTGTFFAFHQAKITPDFLCLSKGITSGTLPFAATLTHNAIYDSFDTKTFFHGHTYTANPLGCAAAQASLAIFESENTLEHVQNIQPLFRSYLEEFNTYSFISNIRSIGLIGAFDLAETVSPRSVYRAALKQGLLLRPLGNVIYFFLPLCITKEELKSVMQRTHLAFKLL